MIKAIKPPTMTLVYLIAMLLLHSLLSLINPWFAGQLGYFLAQKQNLPLNLSLFAFLWLWFFIISLQAGLGFYYQYRLHALSEKLLATLRQKLYEHLQALPLSFYYQRPRGDIISLFSQDAYIISQFITQGWIGIWPQLFIVLGSLILIYRIQAELALLILGGLSLFIILIKLSARRIHAIAKQLNQAYGRTLAILEQNMASLSLIKAYTREDLEAQRFQNSNQDLLACSIDYQKQQQRLAPLSQFIAYSAVLILIAYTYPHIEQGQIAAVDLISLILYALLLSQALSQLASFYGQWQRSRSAGQRLQAIFDQALEEESAKPDIPPLRGEIIFERVSFAYPDRPTLLKQIDWHIHAGETVALIGHNGSGKTSLVHLMLGFEKLRSGRILLDGHHIEDYNWSSIRRQIGLVQQQVLMLNDTIAANIQLGKADASLADIEAAARAAHAWSFIQALPQGLDTLVGEGGIKLSGGQKQRLALARALIKQPKILILDEATAMFDPEGEQLFIEECRQHLAQMTVILITHRPASLALAERIFELKQGRLIECR